MDLSKLKFSKNLNWMNYRRLTRTVPGHSQGLELHFQATEAPLSDHAIGLLNIKAVELQSAVMPFSYSFQSCKTNYV
jgi:hypothetical protein